MDEQMRTSTYSRYEYIQKHIADSVVSEMMKKLKDTEAVLSREHMHDILQVVAHNSLAQYAAFLGNELRMLELHQKQQADIYNLQSPRWIYER